MIVLHKALPTYTFIAGDKAELPCDLNVSSAVDEVALVLWHRDESGSPLYSVDARDDPLSRATHFPASHMAQRAIFNSSAIPAFLRIDGVGKEDEGVYRCRVEYRKSRTETIDMMLVIIVPPREAIIMDEFGQHLHGVIGPYNEGQPVSLICEGEGGDPRPSVRWLRGDDIVDDSFFVTAQGFARNEVILPPLKRTDLLTSLTCQVINTNLTAPAASTVTLDMNLRPTDVRITTPHRPLSADKEIAIICAARGARPPAQISWWLDGEKFSTPLVSESSADEDNLTLSSLLFTPTVEDNLRNLSCRGDNPQLADSVLEDMWVISVHYLPRLSVKLNTPDVVHEGSEVTLTCVVQSLPPISEVEWLHDGRTLGPPVGNSFSNRTFVLSSVGPHHKGEYQCAAKNTEGRTVSEPVLLQVLYIPRCESVRSSMYGVGRTESVSVACAVDAYPTAVNFSWVLVSGDRRHSPLPTTLFESNGTRSVATVSPRVPQDYGELQCRATNAMGEQREPCSFRIIPAGVPGEPQDCHVVNHTQDCLQVACESGEDGGLQQVFQLEVMSGDSDKFIANLTSRSIPTFKVCSLQPQKNLVLVVYAVNSKGRSKQVMVRLDTVPSESEDNETEPEDESEMSVEVLGIVIGTVLVLVVFVAILLFSIKIRSRRTVKARDYIPETEKSDTHLMKECQVSYVKKSQGPDIIPAKSFFKERPVTVVKTCDSEEETALSTIQVDSKKYGEYQSVTYAEDLQLISTPKKIRLLQEMEGDVEELSITVETPLISSRSQVLQVTCDNPKCDPCDPHSRSYSSDL